MAFTFNIISVGDVEFLGQVLNSVAMVCGTGDFKQLCVCGFIIGLLFIGFQCIFQGGQRINLQHTFVCFLCYMLFFGPSCRVVIEDAQGSAYTRTVDNVPIGVGVAGVAVSGIGYGLTTLIEQAYGTVDRQDNYSYGEPLKMIANLRSVAWGDGLWTELDRQCGAGCDTKTAVRNYLNECTMKMVTLQNKSVTSLGNAGLKDFYFDNDSYATELPLYDAGNYVGTLSCRKAWPKLESIVFNKVSSTAFATRLNALLNIKEWTAANIKADATDWTTIDSYFRFLALTGSGAQDFVRMALVEPVYYQAAQLHYASQQDMSSAIAINNAIEQRNTQWAAEQSMFLSAARAFMSFFEGFIYAITPIMGFLLMVGAFGLGLVSKYFMVLAWIQLWLPCLSISNLYTMQGARNALVHANVGEPSFFSINETYQQAANWVATGGMLAAATPMLALFLISGSVYAFTSLAGRLGGRDHFNEKSIVPDAQSVAPLQTVAAANLADRMTGPIASGAKELIPTLSETAGIQKNASAALTRLQSSSSNFAANWLRSGGATSTSAANRSILESIGETVGNIKTASGQTLRQIAEQTSDGSTRTASETNQIIGAMALTTQAGGSLGGTLGGLMKQIGAKAGFSVGGEAQSTSTNSDSASDSTGFTKTSTSSENASESKSLVSAITRATQTALQTMDSKLFTEAKNTAETTGLQEAFSQMEAASKSYSEAKSAVQAFNTSSGPRSYAAIAESMRGSEEEDRLQTYALSLSPSERTTFANDVSNIRRMLGDGHDVNSGEARKANVMAALHHMAKTNNFEGLARSVSNGKLPSMQSASADLSRPTELHTQASPSVVAAKRLEAAESIDAKSSAVAQAGGRISHTSFDEGRPKVEAAHVKSDQEVAAAAQKNLAGLVGEHQRTVLENLGKDRKHNPVGLEVAGAFLDGHLTKNTLAKLAGHDTHLTVSNEDVKQKIHGLSEGQKEYLDKFHDLRKVVMKDQARDVSLNQFGETYMQKFMRLSSASEKLRQEIRAHVFQKDGKDLSPSEKKELDVITRKMATELEMLYRSEAQGQTTRILDFNRAFKVAPASGQRLG